MKDMEIINLKNTSIEDLVNCLVGSFADYFVKMAEEVGYWEKRFAGANVDYELSFGMFDGADLVGFVIHGVDNIEQDRIAFNTGTGVLPAYRGMRIVDKIYDFALPMMKMAGIDKCRLEVIDKNERAIKVYERIGFSKSRMLRCFMGKLDTNSDQNGNVETVFEKILEKKAVNQNLYSWDNSNEAILR